MNSIPADQHKLILIGKATRPHGIKGECSLLLFNKKESVLRKGLRVTITGAFGSQSLTISQIRFGQKCIVAFEQLQGPHGRSQLEALLPFDLYVRRADFLPLPPDQYYLVDLIGCEVFIVNRQDICQDTAWGKISTIENHGAQDIVTVTSYQDQQTLLLPLVSQFFPKIDHQGRKVYCNYPEYDEA